MLKKFISVQLVICILFCLSACGMEETSVDTSSDVTSQGVINKGEETENVTSVSSDIGTTTENVSRSETSTTQSDPIESKQKVEHIHKYSSATCTSPKTCSCGATAGTALGHKFSSATCTSPKICSRCGAISGSSLGHSYANATCTKPKKCTRCGATQGSALGHNYVNNKCTRCGKVDPDSLPVELNSLHLIDSSHYRYQNGSFTDSFGNQYSGAHIFTDLYNGAHPNEQENSYCVYNLNGKYSKFSGSIVAYERTYNQGTYYINIYLDDRLVYSKTGITKTTGKIDFNINVKGGQKLAIRGGGKGGLTYAATLGIVNAQLTK